MDRPPILPVILAGGEGARLAPISTPDQPKPFIPLPEGDSLLTLTLRRVAQAPFLPPLLLGQAAHRYALLNHARAAGVAPAAILLEPRPRHTAMAVAVAVHYVMRHLPARLMAILPADQVIAPTEAWQRAVTQAAFAAEAHHNLCLLGVLPTRADPQFGYMEPGLPLPGSEAFAVTQFIEKPEDPAALLPHCLWNAGHFIASASVLAELFAAHAPEIWEAAGDAVAVAETEWEFIGLGQAAYLSVVPRAFDRAIVERSRPLAVRLTADWQDLGTVAAWEAYTGRNTAFYAAQPVRVDRPWGYYELLAEAQGRREKRLTLFPGCRLSLQRHAARDEHWHILAGMAEVDCDGVKHWLQPGQQIAIPAQCWHRLSNPRETPLIIHEVQTGAPDEADIERQADDYGRLYAAP